MKRLLLILMALLCLLWIGMAAAESAQDLLAAVQDADAANKSGDAESQSEDSALTLKDYVGTEDAVSLAEDGTLTVEIDKSIRASILPPFGWYAFSQDLLEQLEDYFVVFVDPVMTANNMIESKRHIRCVDILSYSEVSLYYSYDKVSQMFHDLEGMDEKTLDKVAKYTAGLYSSTEYSVETYGSTTYIVIPVKSGDAIKGVFHVTYIAGKEVSLIAFPAEDEFTGEELTNVQELISCFNFEAIQ